MNPRSVIITRSKEGNEELSSKLRRSGFSPLTVDTISFAPPRDWSSVDRLLLRLTSFDWLVLTSATGVRFFAERMGALKLTLGWAGKPSVAAVGPKTSSQLAGLGLGTHFMPSSYTTAALAEELPIERGPRALLLRAEAADKSLADRLRERGFRVEGAALYTTTTPGGEAAVGLDDAGLIIFASPSAVRGLCSRLSGDVLDRVRKAKAVCIGPVTEAAARSRGFTDTVTPRSYTIDAVVEALERLTREDE